LLLTELTLEDLAQISGLPIRTLRYYIQEGLLPGPDTRGKYASYSQEHVDTLKLITHLKDLHMPLKDIQHLMETMNAEGIRQMIDLQEKQKGLLLQDANQSIQNIVKEPNSALEYIQNLTELHESVQNMTTNRQSPRRSTLNQQTRQGSSASRMKHETWQKVILTDGVELQLRAQLDAETQQKIDDLIQYAQNLFRQVKGRK